MALHENVFAGFDSKRIGSIDILKGLAIIGVIVLHWAILFGIDLGFVWIVLTPVMYVFMALMGFNFANSWKRNSGLKVYFRKKLLRFFPLFIAAFAATAFLGIALGIPLQFGLPQLIGYFPVPGVGNYFIPIIFQAVVLFPLIMGAYKKHPLALGMAFIAANAAFVIARGYFPLVDYIYRPCIIRFLFPLWFGIRASGKTEWIKRHDLRFRPLELAGQWSYELYLLQVILFSAIGQALVWPFFA
jgi:peptidoglycan/LPS O-acetylase OafA/YrhL